MSRPDDKWAWLRSAVLALACGVLAATSWSEAVKILDHQPLGIDFMPMWAAAHEAFVHPERIYDFFRLTDFEHPLMGAFHGLRPFVYPPTALLLFEPFGVLPFPEANLIWTAAGLVVFVAAMAPRMRGAGFVGLAAVILSAPGMLVLVTGQVTFLIAAMVVTALACAERRPWLAGVLFGLAGVIKPQALILLPVALVAGRQWRVILSTGLTATVAIAASAAVFGVKAWLGWAAALPKFEHLVLGAYGLQRGMITPTALGISMGLDPGALATWRLVFAIGAAAMVWMVFRKSDDPARRIAALLGGSLFVTPYAMHYDAALLAPAAALMLSERTGAREWVTALVAGALLCCAAIPHWGAATVTVFVLLASLTPRSAMSGWVRVPPMGAAARDGATTGI